MGKPKSDFMLEIMTTIPSPVGQFFQSTSYALNNTFVYDPFTRGALQSISVSVDDDFVFTGDI